MSLTLRSSPDIQGCILKDGVRNCKQFIFLRFPSAPDPVPARKWLEQMISEVTWTNAYTNTKGLIPVGLSLTWAGLAHLSNNSAARKEELKHHAPFLQGAAARADHLKDPDP